MRYISTLFGCILFLVLMACRYENKTKDSNTRIETNTATKFSDPIFIYLDSLNSSSTNSAAAKEYLEQELANLLAKLARKDNHTQQDAFEFLFSKLSNSSNLLDFFLVKIPYYLNEPLSPFYDNQLFTSFLKALLQAPNVTEDKKKANSILLNLVHVNTEGNKATNFDFESLRGTSLSLHKLKGDFTILFFFDPTCTHCKEQLDGLQKSEPFADFLNNKLATFVLINPWGNDTIWKEYSSHLPSSWIVGIDRKQDIIEKGLYYLKAAPTVYLLDKEKRVVLKNTDITTAINFVLRNHPD